MEADGSSTRLALITALLLTLLMGLAPLPADAQYFGRNKVQYDDFDFRVLETANFDIYHYGDTDEDAIRDMGRMAERWYERLARSFQHAFEDRKPIIIYRNTPDFQQTNAISGFISQATGGVTESLKNRLIMPFAGSYPETDHVLGHEMVHLFQYDLADTQTGGGQTAIGRAPLWLVEGLAEYLSLGREDAHTAMWMRDAVARDSLPSLDELANPQEFFPYRFGHAFWAYMAGRWGDENVGNLYRAMGRGSLRSAIQRTLEVHPDTLIEDWARATEAHYRPTLEGRTPPAELGQLLLAEEGGPAGLHLAPEVSPDGRHVVVLSQQDPFSIDLVLADASTGQVLGELASSNRNPHFEALAYTNTSGAWSPDGRSFAFVTYRGGDNRIAIADVSSRQVTRTIPVSDVGAIFGLAWSPDGSRIAFSGSRSGINDLFLVDLESEETEALTDDRFMEAHPAWSPDGSRIVFSTDRGQGADLDVLSLPRPGLGFIDVSTGEVETLRVFDGAKHIDPEFGPGGETLYFVADREGFSDVYRYALDDGTVSQVTRATTGVSGLTALSPALSVADGTGDLVFTAFHSGDYLVTRVPNDEAGGTSVEAGSFTTAAALLPPVETTGLNLVSGYLDDPTTGLPSGQAWTVSDYDSDLGLDYIAQPTAGISVDRFGTGLGGSVAAYFSDMLGDRQLGLSVSANGGVQDIGGEALYIDRGSRMNWGLRGGRIPFRSISARRGSGELDGTTLPTLDLVVDRTIIYRASFLTEYPLSRTQRFEFSVGGNRFDFDREIRRHFLSSAGRVIERRDFDASTPEALNLANGSAAFVQDNSQFGFTSPVAGQRARFEVEGNVGSLSWTNALADFRRYFFLEPITLGFRALHYGRYGPDAESSRLSPLFLGQGTFVRGYAPGSFDGDECTNVEGSPEACPEFDRLIGSRLGVANVELRIPVIGTSQFGLIDWAFIPTELSFFADAGVAWTSEETPTFELSRRSIERIPVASAGASLRLNLGGRLIVEVFRAIPFQRPEKSGVWGFQISPGW